MRNTGSGFSAGKRANDSRLAFSRLWVVVSRCMISLRAVMLAASASVVVRVMPSAGPVSLTTHAAQGASTAVMSR